jgi:hypothetical protein
MPHSPTPWIGLAALLAMFLLPFVPNWLFEGPRTVKHWPRRHVCGYCNAPWTSRGHVCVAGPPLEAEASPALEAEIEPLEEIEAGAPLAEAPLRGDLRRLRPSRRELERRPRARISRISR